MRTRRRAIVEEGVLRGYFLGSYSARKLGMQTTGNAGGTHNLIIKPGELSFNGLLRKMQRGLLVTELLGHGVNPVTGDYSRGAAGFWVEHGESSIRWKRSPSRAISRTCTNTSSLSATTCWCRARVNASSVLVRI